MYTEEEIGVIVLDSFAELTYKNKFDILSELKSSTPDFVKFEPYLIKSLSLGVYNKVKTFFYSSEYRKKVLDGLERSGIICVTAFSKDYPEPLKNTPCPPVVLYCKGNVKLLTTECFSIVGSRRTTPNILKECKKFSKELSSRFTIVTGMADGADSAAIDGALDGGKLISVLAYGFDYAYPAVNAPLIKAVAAKGLLLTEFTHAVSPKTYLFPVRNRIIAGLSRATLVVSAAKKSGALITANYAAEYGRDVFAFPYGIGVASGEGCNSLIKKGAALTENILDIFQVYGLDYKTTEKPRLSQEEELLLKLICDAGEAFVPEIAGKMGKLPFQLIPLLTSLEMKGLIARLGGNRYSAV